MLGVLGQKDASGVPPKKGVTDAFDSMDFHLPGSVDQLLRQLEQRMGTAPLSHIEQTKMLGWLTRALHTSVEGHHLEAMIRISSGISRLSIQDPSALISLLNQTITTGELKGQNTTYAWLNELYSGTFNYKTYSVIVSISLIFSALLDHNGDTVARGLVKTVNEGGEEGKNALLVLARALLQAASESHNQSATGIIVALLEKCMEASPRIIGSALTERISDGPFRGKSIVYVLACALKGMSEDNASGAGVLCRVFAHVNKTHPTELAESLFSPIGAGPYRSFNALQIILTGLVTASYTKHNDEFVQHVVAFTEMLLQTDSSQMISALTKKINEGPQSNQNGVMMLVHALVAMVDHDLDTTSCVALLSKLVAADPVALARAFTQERSAGTLRHDGASPLLYLIHDLQKKDDVSERAPIHLLVKALAASPSAVYMMFTLPMEGKTLFLEDFSHAHRLTSDQTSWLANTENADIMQVLGLAEDKMMDTATLLSKLRLLPESVFLPDNTTRSAEIERSEPSDVLADRATRSLKS